MKIKSPSKIRMLAKYIRRVITRTGPHGKECPCPKWGWYVSGCPYPNATMLHPVYWPEKRGIIPSKKLVMTDHARHAIGFSSPSRGLIVGDLKGIVDDDNPISQGIQG